MLKFLANRSRGIFFFSIVAGLLFCSTASSTWAQIKQEAEPNDSREQAQEIRIGEIVEGYFQKDYDSDWYKLTVEKSGKNYLQADLSAVPGIDNYLYVLDANGQQLKEINDAPENGAESIIRFPVESGIYYIRLYGYGKAVKEKYVLSIKTTGPWQEGWESEPNDSRERANDLKLGRTVQGYFDHKRDEDFYKLIIDTPGKSLVLIELSAVPGVNGEIYLYNDKGSEIWRVNDTDKNGPESIFNLALAQGIYYINAWAREINRNDKYTLSTKILGPWQEGIEAEPNDRKEEATDLRLGQNMEGYFQKEGDEDYYKIIIDNPGKSNIQVDLSAVPDVDVRFVILDPKENVLWDANDFSKGEPESVKHFTVTEATYYIRVKGYQKNINNKYSLIARLLGPWQEGQEAEPNDRLESANDLKLGQSVKGYFEKKGDYDYFKVANDMLGKTLVQIDLSPVPGVNDSLTLRDEKGNSIWSGIESSEGGPESIFNLALAQGVYHIEVWGREANAKDAYTLSTNILGPWKVGMEAEPNDRWENATEFHLGQSVEGYYQYDGDQDYYKLIVDEPGRNHIRVDLGAVPGVDAEFDFEDENRRSLWRINEMSKREPESVAYLTVDPGTYYVWVKGYQKNITTKYSLSTRLLGPWREGTEAEPNDEIKRASEVKLNAPLTGRINANNDTDYYILNVPAPGVEIIVMQLSGVPEVRWNFELRDSKDNRLDYSSWGETGQGEEIVKMKFKPGTYYFRIQVRGGKNTGGEYALYAGKPQRPPATAEEVQQALIKALDWLASKQQKDGSWSGYETAFTGLSLMAFIGAKCVQKDYSASVKAALNFLKSRYTPASKYPEGSKDAAYYGGQLGSKDMYEHAIATLGLIEALVDLNDSSLEPIAQDAINLIIRSQNTEHKPETLSGPFKPDNQYYGGWRYNPDSTSSDISVSGWQILTLKAAVNAGFSVPEHIFPAAAGFVRSLQGKQDGSFCYDSPGNSGDSCARAGMGALSLQLCGFPQDPAVAPALRFMQDYAPRWNVEQPGGGYAFYYWYYGTRAMYLSGGDDWRIWKDWMCRFLVDHQNQDGSWDGTSSEKGLDTYRVALGALMLEFCCGHVPIYMSPVKRLGSGFIKVDFEKGAEKEITKNVEIIMDASNSMWGQISGEAKITIARKVLAQIINGLPDSMNVGMRVYGHRYGLNDKLACTDTQLLVPIGPVAKAQLVDTVNKIQLKGKTPLVLSVLEAIKDFEKIPNGSVILVTDGIESCNGDVKSIGPAIKKSGLEIKVHIVGFDIKEKEARTELEAIAKSTEGRYLDAKNASELLSALEQTLKLEYVVLNEKGEEAGRGIVGGDEVKLKEGSYTLRILLAPQPLETKVQVKAGEKAVCVLKKEAAAWKIAY
jgi:hypothetical protein